MIKGTTTVDRTVIWDLGRYTPSSRSTLFCEACEKPMTEGQRAAGEIRGPRGVVIGHLLCFETVDETSGGSDAGP